MATKRRTRAAITRRRDSAGRQTLEVHRLGPHPLVEHFLERLDVARVLDKHIHSNRDGTLSHGRAICVLVHNVLVARDPLYRLSEWMEPIEPKALGLTAKQKLAINDDRMARALDQLAEYGGRGVFFQLALRSIKLFGLKLDRIHFDTTSVTFSGEYRGSGARGLPHITRGHNKDGRPKLKQLVFGLNVTSDGAVPLSHGIFSGNRTDDTLHRDNLDGLRDLLAKDDFIYVADCKLCTKPNLAYIDCFGGKFVTVLPRSRKEDAGFREKLRKKAARWRSILTVERADRDYRIDTYATTKGPQKTEDGFRLIWIRSSAKVEDDRIYREKKLRKAKAALEDLAGRLNKRKLKNAERFARRSRRSSRSTAQKSSFELISSRRLSPKPDETALVVPSPVILSTTSATPSIRSRSPRTPRDYARKPTPTASFRLSPTFRRKRRRRSRSSRSTATSLTSNDASRT